MHIERLHLERIAQTATMLFVIPSTYTSHYTRTIAYSQAHTQAHTQDTRTNVFKSEVVCFAIKRLTAKFIIRNLSQK